ncbi:MAG: hypothetical protein RMI49_01625 [Candidatus Caldarchaeum sp.]|nr:hypothetical protein [Candidatus Caldarchaeum sp.]
MIDKVLILSVEGDFPFKVLRGKIFVKGLEARFEGVVYQSVGGPNVRTMIDPDDMANLKTYGISEGDVELALQQKILNGEVVLEQSR